MQQMLEAEEQEKNEKRKNQIESEKQILVDKIKKREEALNDLSAGRITADSLKKPAKQEIPSQPLTTQTTTKIYQPQKAPSNIIQQGYLPQPIEKKVPIEYSIQQQMKAAGWKDDFVTLRAKQEAFATLLFE